MPMPSLKNNNSDTIKTHSWEDKGIYTFNKGIKLKMNVNNVTGDLDCKMLC